MDEYVSSWWLIVIGILAVAICYFGFVWMASDGVIEIGNERFVRVSAEPIEDWCEDWICEEYDSPFCYYAGSSGRIEITTRTNERGECEEQFTKIRECISQKFVRRRC